MTERGEALRIIRAGVLFVGALAALTAAVVLDYVLRTDIQSEYQVLEEKS